MIFLKKIFILLIYFSFISFFSSFLYARGAICYDLFNEPKHITKFNNRVNFYIDQIFENIITHNDSNNRSGAILAAKSVNGINYNYHWGRDASIVILSLIQQYELMDDEKIKQKIIEAFFPIISFLQETNKFDPNEPKYNPDGTLFTGKWARPQRDTSAFIVIAAIKLYEILSKEKNINTKRHSIKNAPRYSELDKSMMIIEEIIMKNLSVSLEGWNKLSYDFWEEELGTHFATLLIIRRAFIEFKNAFISNSNNKDYNELKDQKRNMEDFHFTHQEQAFINEEFHKKINEFNEKIDYELPKIEEKLKEFFNEKEQMIVATLDYHGGKSTKGKTSNLDTQVILGLLLGSIEVGSNKNFIELNHNVIHQTMKNLNNIFYNLYPINFKENSNKPPVLGRYSEDKYNGYNNHSFGNPWVITTLAAAEYYYKAAQELILKVNRRSVVINNNLDINIELAKKYIAYADQIMERIDQHDHEDGSLNEQIHRDNGFMASVEDLTWNYASILLVLEARKGAINSLFVTP